MASTVLRKDYSSSGNRQRQTISVWVKRCSSLGYNQAIFSVRHTGNANYYGYLRFKTDNSLQYYLHNTNVSLRTNRLFRDVNAWYHIVITVDTTQSTEADRIKMYINGVQETSFQSATYPSQNQEVTFGDNYRHEIGSYDGGYYFDGLMSHFHFITNTAYQASTFGSTDSTTGEWKINTSPTVTYATNSFFILKDGNSGTDQSGQSNNYSVSGGTLTKTEDNPSNVFATMNPLDQKGGCIFSKGNTVMQGLSVSPHDVGTRGTLGMTTGKYYWEWKWSVTSTSQGLGVGIISSNDAVQSSANAGGTNYSFTWTPNGGGMYLNGSTTTNNGNFTGSLNSIFGYALDLDNGTIKIHENGVYYNSGNAVATGITLGKTYLPYFAANGGGSQSILSANFGNGYFGTTAVSSAGTNASGIGIFEYDCPAGFTSLSTKGLNL